MQAFWSLSAYEVAPNGRAIPVDNPLGRHAVGDRTSGLVHGADGSLTFWASPKGAKAVPFRMTSVGATEIEFESSATD